MTLPPASAEALLRLYEQAAPLARFGAWQCDLPGNRLGWTDGVYDLFGIRRGGEVHRPSIVDLYEDASRRLMERARSACIAGGTGFELDCRIRTVGGEPRWMRLTGRIAYEHGRPVRLFGSKQDVTHEKTLWRELEQRVARDPLTGLANRQVFEATLARLAGRRDDGAETALALVDLDGLRHLNDRFGHAAGDAALREAAARLERALPGAPLLARIGGDEFAVVIASRLGGRALKRTLAGALRVLDLPFEWSGQVLRLRASTGVALLGPGDADPHALFSRAESALYIAKAQGGGAIQVFGDALGAVVAGIEAGPLREAG